MDENGNLSCDEFWPQKIKQHWKAFIVFVIGCILAVVGAILVLFWFIETSSIGGMGTATIDQWSVSWIWQFLIYLVLWELLIIGIPVAIAGGVGWYIFWRGLSEEEQAEFKNREKKKHRSSSAGGCFGFLMFIAFSIYLYIIGDFNTPLGDQPYSYWIYSWFTALAWLLIIFGIPAAIIMTIVYFKIWHTK